jgi:hypothetical protein
MSFLISCKQNRSKQFTTRILEADRATAVILQATDIVRLKIGRGDGDPDLEISSEEATANGSVIAFVPLNSTGTVTVTLAQADLASLEGIYDAELLVIRPTGGVVTDAAYSAEDGALHVSQALEGLIGDEESSSSS